MVSCRGQTIYCIIRYFNVIESNTSGRGFNKRIKEKPIKNAKIMTKTNELDTTAVRRRKT